MARISMTGVITLLVSISFLCVCVVAQRETIWDLHSSIDNKINWVSADQRDVKTKTGGQPITLNTDFTANDTNARYYWEWKLTSGPTNGVAGLAYGSAQRINEPPVQLLGEQAGSIGLNAFQFPHELNLDGVLLSATTDMDTPTLKNRIGLSLDLSVSEPQLSIWINGRFQAVILDSADWPSSALPIGTDRWRFALSTLPAVKIFKITFNNRWPLRFVPDVGNVITDDFDQVLDLPSGTTSYNVTTDGQFTQGEYYAQFRMKAVSSDSAAGAGHRIGVRHNPSGLFVAIDLANGDILVSGEQPASNPSWGRPVEDEQTVQIYLDVGGTAIYWFIDGGFVGSYHNLYPNFVTPPTSAMATNRTGFTFDLEVVNVDVGVTASSIEIQYQKVNLPSWTNSEMSAQMTQSTFNTTELSTVLIDFGDLQDDDVGTFDIELSLFTTLGVFQLPTLDSKTTVHAGADGTTAVTLRGPIASINDLIDGLGVTFPLLENPPLSEFAVISVNASDLGNSKPPPPLGPGSFNVTTVSFTLRVNVFDAPNLPAVVSVPPGVTITEDSKREPIPGVNVTDIYALQTDNMTLTVSADNAATLSFTAESGNITVNTEVYSKHVRVVGGAINSTSVTVRGPLALINHWMTRLLFTPATNFYGVATVFISVNDEGHNGSPSSPEITTANFTVTVTGVDDPILLVNGPFSYVPVVSLCSPAVHPCILEDGQLRVEGLSVAATDNADVTVTMTTSEGGTILLGRAVPGVVATHLQDDVLQLVGLVFDVAVALNNYTYMPSPNFYGTDTVNVTLVENAPSPRRDSASLSILVESVQSGPSIDTSLATGLSGIEDTEFTINGVAITDTDPLMNLTVTMTVTVGSGKVYLGDYTGLALVSGSRSGSSLLVLRGLPSVVAARFDDIRFLPSSSFNGDVVVDIEVDDSVFAPVDDTIALQVAKVDDLPIVNVSGVRGATGQEETVFHIEGLEIFDVDNDTLTVTLSLTETSGVIWFTTVPNGVTTFTGNNSASVTAIGLPAGIHTMFSSFFYRPNLHFAGGDTVAITADDSFTEVPGSFDLLVIDVNDPPQLSVVIPWSSGSQNERQTLNSYVLVSDNDSIYAGPTNILRVLIQVTLGFVELSDDSQVTVITGANDGTDTTLEIDGSISELNQALNVIYFTPDVDFFGNTSMTFNLTDSGGLSASGTVGLTVVNVANPPVIDVSGAAPLVVLEDSSVRILGVVVFDVDFSELNVTLTTNDGQLSFNASSHRNVTMKYDASTGTAVLSGLESAIAALLNDGIVFTPTKDSVGAAQIIITATDGYFPLVVANILLTITPVPDPPVVGVPGNQTVQEETVLLLPGITIFDVDGDDTTLVVSAEHGILSLLTSSVAVVSSNSGHTLTMTGTLEKLNETVANLVYVSPNYNGVDKVTVTAEDPALPDVVDVFFVTVTPLEDAPTVLVNVTGANNTQDTVFDLIGLRVRDNDGGLVTAYFTVDRGTIEVNNSGSLVTTDQITVTVPYNVPVQYTPPAFYTGTAQLTVYAQDPELNLSPLYAITLTIRSVAEKPIITVPGSQAPAPEGSTQVVSGSDIVDHDNDHVTVTASIPSEAGFLRALFVDGGVIFTTPNDGTSNVLIIEGYHEDVGATLASIEYTPFDLDYFGEFRLTFDAVDDTGLTADTRYVNMTVTNVDDPPVVSGPLLLTIDEDSGIICVPFNLTEGDDSVLTVTVNAVSGTITLPDGAALITFSTATQIVMTGQPAELSLALDRTCFTPNQDYNGPGSISAFADDSVMTDSHVMSVVVNAVADAPVIDISSIANTPLGEDLTQAISGLVVTDADGINEDVKIVLHYQSGTIAVSASSSVCCGGTFDFPNTRTFWVRAPVSAVNGASDTVFFTQYTPDPAFFGADLLNITATSYPDGLRSSVTFPITVLNSNTAPAVDLSGVSVLPIAFNEDTNGIADDVSFTDPNSLDTFTVTIVALAGGTIALPHGAEQGVTYGGAATGTVTLSGGNRTATINAMSRIRWTPPPNLNGPANLQVTVTDDAAESDTELLPFYITPTADPPIVTVSPLYVDTPVNTPYTITGVSASDVDGLSTTALVVVTEGTASLPLVPVSLIVTGDGTTSLSLVGPVDDITSALSSIVFTPDSFFASPPFGEVRVTLEDDNGSFGDVLVVTYINVTTVDFPTTFDAGSVVCREAGGICLEDQGPWKVGIVNFADPASDETIQVEFLDSSLCSSAPFPTVGAPLAPLAPSCPMTSSSGTLPVVNADLANITFNLGTEHANGLFPIRVRVSEHSLPYADLGTINIFITPVADLGTLGVIPSIQGGVSVVADEWIDITGVNFTDPDTADVYNFSLTASCGQVTMPSASGLTITSANPAATFTASGLVANIASSIQHIRFFAPSVANSCTLTITVVDDDFAAPNPTVVIPIIVTSAVADLPVLDTSGVSGTTGVQDTMFNISGLLVTDDDAAPSDLVNVTFELFDSTDAPSSNGVIEIIANQVAAAVRIFQLAPNVIRLHGNFGPIMANLTSGLRMPSFTPSPGYFQDGTIIPMGGDYLRVTFLDATGLSDSADIPLFVLSTAPPPVVELDIDAPSNTTTTQEAAVALTGANVVGGASTDVFFVNITVDPVAAAVIAVTNTGGGVSVLRSTDSEWTLSGTTLQLNLALASISFTPVEPYFGVASLTFVIADTLGGANATDTALINVTEVLNDPVLDATGATPLTANEGPGPQFPNIGVLTLTDTDPIDTYTLTVSCLFAGSTLSFVTESSCGSPGAGNPLQISGFNLADTGACLANIAFNLGDSTAFGFFDIDISVTDSGGLSDSTSVNVQVIDVVHLPVITVPAVFAPARLQDVVVRFGDAGSFTLTDADNGINELVVSVSSNGVLGMSSFAMPPGLFVAISSDELTVTATGSPADLATLLPELTYTPLTALCGNTLDTISYSVKDDSSATLVSDSSVVNVLCAGTPPVVDASGASPTSGPQDVTLGPISGIVVSDTATDVLSVVLDAPIGQIRLNDVTGLTFNGGTSNDEARIEISGTADDMATAMATISFIPPAAFIGSVSITITATDPEPTTVADTFTVTFTATQHAPVLDLAAVNTPTVTTEGTASVSAQGVVVSDADNDVLALTISVDQGGTINFAALPSVVVASAPGAGPAVSMVLTGLQSDLVSVVDGLTIQPPSATFAGDITVSLHVTDGTGTTDDTASFIVRFLAINDPPQIDTASISPFPIATNEDTPVTITGLRFVELDGDDVNVTYTVSSGRLELITVAGVAEVSANNGSTVIYSGPLIAAPGNPSGVGLGAAGDTILFTPFRNFAGSVVLTISVVDVVPLPLSDLLSLLITVNAVEDSTPVIDCSGVTATTFAEGTSPMLLSGAQVTDGDNGDVTVIASSDAGTLSFPTLPSAPTVSSGPGTSLTGPVADVGSVLANVNLVVGPTFSGLVNVTLEAVDSTRPGVNTTCSIRVVVTSVDDTPTVSTSPVADHDEDTSQTLVNRVSVADPDNELFRLVLTVGSGTINVTEMCCVTFAGSPVGAVVEFSGSLTDVNAALQNLVYKPTQHFSGTESLVVYVEGLTDGLSAVGSESWDVTSIPDRPVIATIPAVSGFEDTQLAIDGVQISDPDLGDILNVTMSVSGGVLVVVPQPGVTGTSSGSTIRLIGQSAPILATFSTISYDPNQDFEGSDTLMILVNDALHFESDTIGITIAGFNDVPTLVLPTPAGCADTCFGQVCHSCQNEDTDLVITTITVGDPDAGTIQLSIQVQEGLLDFTSVGSGSKKRAASDLKIVAGGNVFTSPSMTLNGSVADMNAALSAGLSYRPNPDFAGADLMQITLTDGVHTLARQFRLLVQPVGDRPVVSGPSSIVTFEDTLTIIQPLVFDDVDDGTTAAQNTLDVTFTVSHGTLNLPDAVIPPMTVISSNLFASASINVQGSLGDMMSLLTQVEYLPTSEFNGADTLRIVAYDETGREGNLTIDIVVVLVEDLPILDDSRVTSNGPRPEGQRQTVKGISLFDGDGGNMTVTVKANDGTLRFADDYVLHGGDVVIEDGKSVCRAGGTCTVSGLLADINATLFGGIVYNPADHFCCSDRITIAAFDSALNPSNIINFDVSITTVNTVPHIVYLGPNPIVVTEDTPFDVYGLFVNDSDILSNALLTTTVDLSVLHGRLSLLNSAGLTVTPSKASSISVVGALVSRVEQPSGQLNDGIEFDPDLDYDGPDVLVVVATDGVNAGLTSTLNIPIVFVSVNDGPVIDVATVGVLTTPEEVDLEVTGIELSDPDNGNITVTFTTKNGLVTLKSGYSPQLVVIDEGYYNGALRTLKVFGPWVKLNEAINNPSGALVYSPDVDFNGVDEILIFTYDDDNLNATALLTVTVTALEDAPIVTTGTQFTNFTEDLEGFIVDTTVFDGDFSTITIVAEVLYGVISLEGLILPPYHLNNLTFLGNVRSGARLTVTGPSEALGDLLKEVSYIPNQDYNNINSDGHAGGAVVGSFEYFTVTATDPQGNSNSESLKCFVFAVPDDPIVDFSGVGPMPAGPENTDQAINNALVYDPDGGAMTVSVDLLLATGTLDITSLVGITTTVGTNGASSFLTFTGDSADMRSAMAAIVYSPNPNFNGPDELTITAVDADSLISVDADLLLAVSAVNEPPVATVPGLGSATEEIPEPFVGFNVTDPDADETPGELRVTLTADHGTLFLATDRLLNCSGMCSINEATSLRTVTFWAFQVDAWAALEVVTFIGDEDFSGTATITLYVNDQGYTGSGGALSDTETFSFTVVAVNDAPTLVADVATTDEDNSVIIDVLANDFDPEGYTIDRTSLAIISTPDNGVLVVNSTLGLIEYTPNYNFNGGDRFTYTACDLGPTGDGAGAACQTDPQGVIVLVGPVNDGPFVSDDFYDVPASDIRKCTTCETLEDTLISVFIMDNDFDIDNGTVGFLNPGSLIVVTASPNGGVATARTIVGPSSTFGVFDYVPGENYFGADTFEYQVCDSGVPALCARSTVRLFITSVNDPPVAISQLVVTDEEVAIDIVVTGTDVEGDAFTLEIAPNGLPTMGTLVLAADFATSGKATYTPFDNVFGEDAFFVLAREVGDPTQVSLSEGEIKITISSKNDGPTTKSQTATVEEDSSVTIDLEATDVDSDNLLFYIQTLPLHGTVTFPDGTTTSEELSEDNLFIVSVLYTPDADYFGTDSFEFRANDFVVDSSASSLVTITVTPVPDRPDVADQSLTVLEGEELPITLFGFDSDSTSLAFSIFKPPSVGVVKLPISAGGVTSYTPNDGVFGVTDEFTYQISALESDGSTLLSLTPGRIQVVILFNNVPVAANSNVETNEDTSVTFLLDGGDIDGPRPAMYNITKFPNDGSTVATSGSRGKELTFTPDENYFGSQTLRFFVSDGLKESQVQKVTINVLSVDDRPVGESVTFNITAGTTVELSLVAADADNDDISCELIDGSNNVTSLSLPHGDVTILGYDDATETCQFRFKAVNSVATAGTDRFQYRVVNELGKSSILYTVVIGVDNNRAPVANDQFISLLEDTPITFILDVSDPDMLDVLTFKITKELDNKDSTITPKNIPSSQELTYTPAANWFGTDTIRYTVSDGIHTVGPIRVRFTVTDVKDAAVAVSFQVNVVQGVKATFRLDGGGDGFDDVVFSIDEGPKHTSAFNLIDPATGKVTFTAEESYIGTDSFTFTLSDETKRRSVSASSSAKVTVNVLTSGCGNLVVEPQNGEECDDTSPTCVDCQIIIPNPPAGPDEPEPESDKINCDGLTTAQCLGTIVNNTGECGQSCLDDIKDISQGNLTNEEIDDIIEIVDEVIDNIDKGDQTDQDVGDVIDIIDNVKESVLNNLKCGESTTISSDNVEIQASKFNKTDAEGEDVNFDTDGSSFSVDGDDLAGSTKGNCISQASSEIKDFDYECTKGCACDERVANVHSLTFYDETTGKELEFSSGVTFTIQLSDEFKKRKKEEEEDSCADKDDELKPECQFYDRSTGCFSSEGCKLISFNNDEAECKCTHLTDFTVVFGAAGNGQCDSAGASFEADWIFIASVTCFGVAVLIVIIIVVTYHYGKLHIQEKKLEELRHKMMSGQNDTIKVNYPKGYSGSSGGMDYSG